MTLCPHCKKAIISKHGKKILRLLKNKMTIKEISQKTGMTQPLICYHMRKLLKDDAVQYDVKTGKLIAL